MSYIEIKSPHYIGTWTLTVLDGMIGVVGGMLVITNMITLHFQPYDSFMIHAKALLHFLYYDADTYIQRLCSHNSDLILLLRRTRIETKTGSPQEGLVIPTRMRWWVGISTG